MNTQIRMAEKQDIPALCNIWKSCFSDSEEYIRLFYKENFERIETLILCVDGTPVSMVHMLPASLENKGSSQPAKFLYAAGTLPAYRGRRYMEKLIHCTQSRAKESGYALFLRPATPSLTTYYRTYGFEVGSYFRLVTLSPSEPRPLAAEILSCREYNRMRDAAFSDTSYVKWDDKHIHWCIEENKFFSGKTIKIRYENKDYFLLGYPNKNVLIINETDLSLNQLKKLSGALCAAFGTELVKAYMPDEPGDKDNRIISSVFFNAPANNTYVNLILI